MMAVKEIRVWAECNDGHTTLAGISVDDLTISEISKWAGVIPWCSQKDMEVADDDSIN